MYNEIIHTVFVKDKKHFQSRLQLTSQYLSFPLKILLRSQVSDGCYFQDFTVVCERTHASSLPTNRPPSGRNQAIKKKVNAQTKGSRLNCQLFKTRYGR